MGEDIYMEEGGWVIFFITEYYCFGWVKERVTQQKKRGENQLIFLLLLLSFFWREIRIPFEYKNKIKRGNPHQPITSQDH